MVLFVSAVISADVERRLLLEEKEALESSCAVDEKTNSTGGGVGKNHSQEVPETGTLMQTVFSAGR